jgi:NADPH-dependent FMN reductase
MQRLCVRSIIVPTLTSPLCADCPRRLFGFVTDLLGCDVRVYNPRGLPVRDPALENHIKVKVSRNAFDITSRREYAPLADVIVLFLSFPSRRNRYLQELRALTHWSDGHMWVSPEMHGTITGVFKNQIDWSECSMERAIRLRPSNKTRVCRLRTKPLPLLPAQLSHCPFRHKSP